VRPAKDSKDATQSREDAIPSENGMGAVAYKNKKKPLARRETIGNVLRMSNRRNDVFFSKGEHLKAVCQVHNLTANPYRRASS